jgi:hypothetical protein
MSDVDPNLVKAIAEQVLAAIRVGSGGGGKGASSPTEIHAPSGQCTGDYSKFPELKGLQTAPGPSETRNAKHETRNETVLTGVVTVSQLKGVRGAVRLAKGAILTPLAADFIKEKKVNVVTDGQAPSAAVNVSAGIATGAPIFWWIGGQCPSVAKVVETLRPNVLASGERSSGESLRAVVKELAGLVKSKRVCCGLLFVDSAARAACYANRCHSLRAIVGTNDKAVSDGVEQLGANVLIIEYPQLGYKGMMGLIKPFLESHHAAPAAVLKELNELAACG